MFDFNQKWKKDFTHTAYWRPIDEVQAWKFWNNALSLTVNLRTKFEKKSIVSRDISVKSIKEGFRPWSVFPDEVQLWNYMITALLSKINLRTEQNRFVRYKSSKMCKLISLLPDPVLTTHKYCIIIDNEPVFNSWRNSDRQKWLKYQVQHLTQTTRHRNRF